MYQLLLVEDEVIERESLSELVDWRSMGVELCASAESAEEALVLADTLRVDILLTDIRLLGLSGLELARRLLERLPRLKVIFHSGYSEFDYARQALDMGACSFLTKPVDMAELRAVLGRAVAELNTQRERERSVERLRQLVQDNTPLIRRHFFERLVAGSLSDAEILKSMDYFGLDAVQGRFAVLLVELDDFEQASVQLDWLALQALLEAVGERVRSLRSPELVEIWYMDRGRFAALLALSAPEPRGDASAALAMAGRIRAAAMDYGSVTVGVGVVVGRIHDLPRSLQSASVALAYRFAAGQGQVISHADATAGEPEHEPLNLDPIEEALALAVETGNAADACAQVERLFRAALRRGWDVHRMQAAGIRLLGRVMLLLHDRGENSGAFEAGAPWAELLACRTAPDMQVLLSGFVERCCERMSERRATADRNIVRRIVDYIDAHLDQRITAADLATEFSYSPNYIGVVFKKDRGKTLTDYLKDVRLERARELLRNPANRIGEVAARVGYPNVSYFGALFKKKYGVNPGEYKERA